MSRILVPFDGSDNARDALSFACETFADEELLVLFVVDTSVTYQPERTVGMKLGDIYEKREEEGRTHLSEAEELAAEHGTEVVTTLEHGKPSRVILEQIDDDIDHVVLGSHSQSALERFFLGSVAERVVERSPASVTVIR
ncbi:universal stress protein [Halovenus aranensis]|jgi:nucleotide-binding universal stress UspA family protein|nr:universal stress protein [Halovenus aranensis]